MNSLALAIGPLLDAAPVDVEALRQGSLLRRLRSLSTLAPLLRAGKSSARWATFPELSLQGGQPPPSATGLPPCPWEALAGVP